MASVFKPKGRSTKHDPYLIEYTNEKGKRSRVVGYSDKGLSTQKAVQLERDAKLRRDGLIDTEEEKRVQRKKLLASELLEDFKSVLKRTNTEKHANLTESRIKLILNHACIETIGDIDVDSVEQAVFEIREEKDLGNKTFNHYVQAINSFCNWLVPNRLKSNPLAGVTRLNEALDIRRKRRALSPTEMAKLLKSAKESDEIIQCYTGVERARFYLFSYFTGLRRREMGSLTKRSFSLDSSPPMVTVVAACSKHRKEDKLPIHPELLIELKSWLKGMKADENLFPKLEKRRTWLCVKKDLERAKIPYVNEEGVADFHATGRHSYITGLLENGASIAETMELARHSDVRMTMRYAHIGIESQHKALSSLPSPTQAIPNDDSRLVSDRVRSDSHSCSNDDNGSRKEDCSGKKITSDKARGYVATSRNATTVGTDVASVEAAGSH